jgi:hypothetical protein
VFKKNKDNVSQTNDVELPYPPGFTPDLGEKNKDENVDVVYDHIKFTSRKKHLKM